VSEPAKQQLTDLATRIVRRNSLKKNPELANEDALNIELGQAQE
jgi:hypothetical protein